MATIGNISVPDNPPVGTFPLHVEFGFTTIIDPPVGTPLQFKGTGDLMRTQRFLSGTGARQWNISRELDAIEHDELLAFWEDHQASTIPFTFNLPLEDGTTTPVTARFASEPASYNVIPGMLWTVQLVLIEHYTGAGPTYDISSTVERIASAGSALGDALTAQAQQLIKLVTIRPKKAGYPAIYLSDQLCTIGGITYLPRLLKWDGIGQVAIGMPGVGSESDDVTLVFGNADRVMTALTGDVQLDLADVQCSFYHVQSKILCNFWAGEVIAGGWASNTGPQFVMKCSDPIASPFYLAPPRTVDRLCNKMHDDDNECPFSRVGSLNPDYPNAQLGVCDHGLSTENGCYAHNMAHSGTDNSDPSGYGYFNGVVAFPQSILTKDNSTGIFGFFRNTVVAASLISDSIYGHAIPIIVTDISFPVTALLLAGRDEGDFYDAIAIVGEGPMTLSILSTLDGQLNHGYPGFAGIRFIEGSDPALPLPAGAPFPPLTLAQATGGDLQLTPPNQPQLWSAGTAAIELRRKDQAGTQLTTLDDHSMQAIVDVGWQGWVWGPSLYTPGVTGSARSATRLPVTNPVWFAVNLYLLCKKLFNADAATQELYLDLPTCIAAAAICDLQVDRIVELDEGQETQWKFIGALIDQKALRDWMADILLNCLGYYTFKNGKLSIGVRENGASTIAYTDGNMLWRTLQLSPLGPQFTRLVASFADREYQYVANSAVYQDDDYAQELGGGTRVIHRTAQMNLSGTADISPATRFVATRCREEVGGITAQERVNARNATWKTSALGFDTSPGDVCSITNEDMPGGVQKVRVQRWKLNDDWSIELTGRACTDSMYDLVQGPKPADIRPGIIPGSTIGGSQLQPVWRPNLVTAYPGDPYFDQFDKTFQATTQYTPLSDGSTQASLVISGEMPVTDPTVQITPIINRASLSPTGGFLLGGRSYFISVCAIANQAVSNPGGTSEAIFSSLNSPILAFQTAPGSDTSSIALSGIAWPPAPDGGWTGCVVFASIDDKQVLCEQLEFGLDTGGLPPTSITLTGQAVAGPPSPPNAPDTTLHFATYAPPNQVIDRIRVKVKLSRVPSVVNGLITAVGAGTLRCMHLAADRSQDTNPTEGGIAWSADAGLLAADDWSPGGGRPQRVLSVISRKLDGTTPLLNFLITTYDPTSGTFGCSPDPSAAGVGPGDVFLVRYSPQWLDNGTGPNTGWFDPGAINGQYPGGNQNDCAGSICRIIMGPGRGQTHRVIISDATGYQFDKGFVGVDATSVPIIEFPTWLHTADSDTLDISSFGQLGSVGVVVSDLLETGLIVQATLVDTTGKESPDILAPTREVFIYGDTAFGVGGLNLGGRVEFGRGDSGGGVAVQAGDVSSVLVALYPGFLQGYDIVSEPPDTVGDSTFDFQKWDSAAWVSVLGGTPITIPSGTSMEVILSTAFAAALNLAVAVGDKFRIICLTVGATAPVSPVIRVYWGKPTPTGINMGGVGA